MPLLFLDQQNFLDPIDLVQFDFDHFAHRRWHGASHKRGFDRQLTMAAVDQYTKLHSPRATMRKQCV